MKGHGKFSESRQCGHCGNHATMKVVAGFKNVSTRDYGDGNYIAEGDCYNLLQCPACKKVELQSYDFCDYAEFPSFNYQTLYPSSPDIPLGIPKKIQIEYMEALKHKRSSPNAYGVLIGRVLEQICQDKKANTAIP